MVPPYRTSVRAVIMIQLFVYVLPGLLRLRWTCTDSKEPASPPVHLLEPIPPGWTYVRYDIIRTSYDTYIR